MMEIDLVTSQDELLCLSPLDGRYSNKTEPLREYFSEYSLIRQRLKVEVEYFIALQELAHIPLLEDIEHSHKEQLRNLYKSFSIDCATKSFR